MKDLYSFKHIPFVFWSILFISVTLSCSGQKSQQRTDKGTGKSYFINGQGDTVRIIVKSEAQWQKQLTPQEYDVLRKKGTERAFTGSLLDIKGSGQYVCKACRYPLFSSEHKYNSGSGWPSFYDALDKNAILEETDYHLGYARTEVMCKRCGGHLGHVFPDGPAPTGLRYCINSVSLDFQKSEK
jgi:peptide-methionine (R)-S-oxide reductase